MSFQYTNRTRKTYYLREGKTKTGKPRYFFSTQQEGKGIPVEKIPEGYEIYERPENAQVFLRKKQRQLITDIEKHLIKQSMRKLKSSRRYLVDYKTKFITIYESTSDSADVKSMLGGFINNMLPPGVNADATLNALADISDQNYTAMLRFCLVDKKKRQFTAERFCFRGSIDDWIHLDGPDSLKDLCKKYMPILGTDEFFETPYY